MANLATFKPPERYKKIGGEIYLFTFELREPISSVE